MKTPIECANAEKMEINVRDRARMLEEIEKKKSYLATLVPSRHQAKIELLSRNIKYCETDLANISDKPSAYSLEIWESVYETLQKAGVTQGPIESWVKSHIECEGTGYDGPSNDEKGVRSSVSWVSCVVAKIGGVQVTFPPKLSEMGTLKSKAMQLLEIE